MRIFTSYILRHLVISTFIVTTGLVCIIWLAYSLRFIDLIISKGIDVGAVLTLTSLLLPNFLVTLLPIALFAATVFVYTRLAGERELVALRASGLGPLELAKPAFVLAGAVAVAGYGLTLWAGPQSTRAFKEMRWSIRYDISSLAIQEGSFTPLGAGVTIYVRKRSANGELSNVLVYDARDPDHTVVMMAKRGALIKGTSPPRVALANGSRHDVDKTTGKMSLLYFDSWTMDLDIGADDPGVRFRKASERGLHDLFTVREGRENPPLSKIDIRKFRAEGHQRLANPLNAISFVSLALGVLMSGPFNRRGSARHLGLAVLSLTLAQAAITSAGDLTVSFPALWPMIYGATLLPGLIGLILLVKPRVFDRLPPLSLKDQSAAP